MNSAGNKTDFLSSKKLLVLKTDCLSSNKPSTKAGRKRDRIRAAKHQKQTTMSTAAYINKLQAQNKAFKLENEALKQTLNLDDTKLSRVIVDLNSDIINQMNKNDEITKKGLEFKNQINDLIPHHERCHDRINKAVNTFEKMTNKHEYALDFVEKVLRIINAWRREVEQRLKKATNEIAE